MTDHEKLVQIASMIASGCDNWNCQDCPVERDCLINDQDQYLRFAAAKKLVMEARDETVS